MDRIVKLLDSPNIDDVALGLEYMGKYKTQSEIRSYFKYSHEVREAACYRRERSFSPSMGDYYFQIGDYVFLTSGSLVWYLEPYEDASKFLKKWGYKKYEL